jgi:hypothetical protein
VAFVRAKKPGGDKYAGLRTVGTASQSSTKKYREKIRNFNFKDSRKEEKNCDTHFLFECVRGRPKFIRVIVNEKA